LIAVDHGPPTGGHLATVGGKYIVMAVVVDGREVACGRGLGRIASVALHRAALEPL
jgi:hypothetical protein